MGIQLYIQRVLRNSTQLHLTIVHKIPDIMLLEEHGFFHHINTSDTNAQKKFLKLSIHWVAL